MEPTALRTEWRNLIGEQPWEVTEAPHVSPAAARLLDEGWEPFAVYVTRFGDATLVLRRRRVASQ